LEGKDILTSFILIYFYDLKNGKNLDNFKNLLKRFNCNISIEKLLKKYDSPIDLLKEINKCF